jgi:hypothetical protein
MNKIKVTVSLEDIDLGVRGESACCPIAIAVKRLKLSRSDFDLVEVLPDADVMDGDSGDWTVCVGYDVEYLLPEQACQFAADFDAGLSVSPFEFEMTEIENKSYC